MEEYSFGLTYGSDEILFSGEYSGRENNFGSLHLAATQCASAYMDVTVVRDDIKSTLHFKKGYNEGGLHKEPSQEKTGTTIRFALDKEVFTQTVLPANDLKSQLKKLALVIPGLRCTYIGEKEQVEFCYGSIREYLQEKSDLPVFYTNLEATGRDRYNRPEYTARVTLAVGLCRESEHLCIHNFRELSRYGTHYTALLKRLKREFPEHIKPEDLSVVLVTRCGIGVTAWENATYQSIRNVMIRDMTEDAAGKPLSDFLYQHKDQIKKGHR